jgi:hypothetical protein
MLGRHGNHHCRAPGDYPQTVLLSLKHRYDMVAVMS